MAMSGEVSAVSSQGCDGSLIEMTSIKMNLRLRYTEHKTDDKKGSQPAWQEVSFFSR